MGWAGGKNMRRKDEQKILMTSMVILVGQIMVMMSIMIVMKMVMTCN